MRLVLTGFLIFGSILTTQFAVADPFEVAPKVHSEINVTVGSTPGWIPTVDQRQSALKTVQAFLEAIENARYAEAYDMQAQANKRQTPEQFAQYWQKFNVTAGPLKFWRVAKITWTNDSQQAPLPGTYAAVDLVGQFANIDRSCGFVILHQPPAGGGFAVMGRQHNFLDNPTARQIEEKKSKEEVARLWNELSRYCPNYAPPPELR